MKNRDEEAGGTSKRSMSLRDLETMIEGESKSAPGDRPTVVVVDDDALVRDSLQSVLQDKYEVRTCPGALEAVSAIDNDTSCVILDVKMPTHDGFWVSKQVRKRTPDVPIIFHSAYQDLKDPYEIINNYHPFGYVVKGDTLSTLLVLITNAVRHSDRLREGRRTIVRLREAREKVRELYQVLLDLTVSLFDTVDI
jgi:cyclic di-GMP phosphodiesterase